MSMQEWWHVGNFFALAACIMFWAFCIGYTYFAKWWRSESGAHLFTFSIAMAIVFTYVNWRIIWPPQGIEKLDLIVRALIFMSEFGLATWRFSILIRRQALTRRSRVGKRRQKDNGPRGRHTAKPQ